MYMVVIIIAAVVTMVMIKINFGDHVWSSPSNVGGQAAWVVFFRLPGCGCSHVFCFPNGFHLLLPLCKITITMITITIKVLKASQMMQCGVSLNLLLRHFLFNVSQLHNAINLNPLCCLSLQDVTSHREIKDVTNTSTPSTLSSSSPIPGWCSGVQYAQDTWW